LRTRSIFLILAAVLLGALGGSLFAPQPAGAVNKDMIQLQDQVAQLLQGQQDLRSAVDTNGATLKTLTQQSLESINKLSADMSSLQKSVQEVQANTGSRIDTMTQQTQGLSDNMQDVQARISKLGQQLTDMQNVLQSIDAKMSGSGSPATTGASGPAAGTNPAGADNTTNSAPNAAPDSGAPNAGNSAEPSVSADTLYQNALRDYTSGKYDLAHQEFSDYIMFFPTNDLASNSQFYLGEIAYSQNDFKVAIASYEDVLAKYPRSFKLAASLMKKGMAELELGQKPAGIRDLREVIRRFPGSDESRHAQAKLHELGVATTAPRPPSH